MHTHKHSDELAVASQPADGFDDAEEMRLAAIAADTDLSQAKRRKAVIQLNRIRMARLTTKTVQ